MKIVVLDGYTENPGDLSWAGLEALGDVTVYDRTAPEDVVARIGDAEVLLVNKVPISEETMKQTPNLKYIGVLATGFNVIDTKAAKERGITVTNIPTYGTDTVGQYTIALLLELCHHVGDHSASVKKGEWTSNQDWCYWLAPLVELSNKTFGIIGYGRIGQRAGEIAKALNMNVIAYDQGFKVDEFNGTPLVSLDEVLAQSDVITLHCPLTPETEGMINRETISKMKDGVLLINTSRGPLVNEQDLSEALASGKVAGAALDVVSTEPIQEDNPLLKNENVILTPHIAWATKEARSRLMDIAVANVAAFLNGKPENVVN